MDTSTLILVDGSGYIFRGYYAIRSMTTPDKVEFALGATVTMTAEAEERENATILDTSGMTPKQLGAAADRWILERLAE